MRREYLPIETLPAWQCLNGIVAKGVAFQKLGSSEYGTDKGSAIVATEAKSSDENDATPEILLQIPSDLVLSLETVHNYAKSDRYLHDVLEAIDDFGRTARGAIMIFLLVQLSHTSPDIRDKHEHVGVSNPWTEYVKFLPPSFPLPTSYTTEEQELLRGTSLAEALDAKFMSLEREFENLHQATESIKWCQQSWWDEENGSLTIQDWKYVDAAYRSRMLDIPGSGLAMVPCIDMANHMCGDGVKALYDADSNGNAVLQLRWGKSLQAGEEVTISYGDEKSASEMVFSYGFLDSAMTEAREICLNIDMPEDDPLSVAKQMFCQQNRGVRITAQKSEEQPITWESPLVWIACVNEEDGLNFGLAQTIDGGRELETTWKGEQIQSPDHLRELLAADPLWEIIRLRAVVLLLERFETQLSLMQEMEEVIANLRENEEALTSFFRPEIFELITRFRGLEADLLEKAVEELIKQRTELLGSSSVAAYFSEQTGVAEEVEDFS
ncbi:hypothetical protein PENANT_c023G10356 [Penicillium antarcticum]|uniref:Uncharacterized protein n=1 Tax=Penicillium antarcticum TaxID=416450 RepID=A0A1V6PZ52_9EURO|nr:uncharacterized protein N7508_006173 [Penicillium antarcticum]KAJ5301310.1 hypothetical protein N7508_006173 [Penicillium antarcticum]OQD82057.1 hypothetical protein PENANT_c023G10356 [Penicillium antarcticum]